MTRLDRVRRAMAEFIGTAFLLMAIVGSGIAAQRLSPHDVGLELLENSTATATALVAIILALGPISGAHLNPMVSLVNRVLGGMSTAEMLIYWIAQLAGAALGTILSNLMFSLPIIEMSTKVRASTGLWLAEAIATFGLVLVIFAIVRSKQVIWSPSPSVPTSPALTGSLRRPVSPIQPSPSLERLQSLSPESRLLRFFPSSSRRSSAP